MSLQELHAGALAAAFPVNAHVGDRPLGANGGLGPIELAEPPGVGVQLRRLRELPLNRPIHKNCMNT